MITYNFLFINVVFTVFVRSTVAYEAFKSFNIFQLPVRSTLQAYTGCFLNEGGASWDSTAKYIS